jgi:hypothetical protein
MTRFVVAASIFAASALSASAADLPARSFKAPFLGSLSVKAEYLHADFGARNYFDPPVVDVVTVNTRKTSLTDDIFRAGLNYRFGWGGPVVAK